MLLLNKIIRILYGILLTNYKILLTNLVKSVEKCNNVITQLGSVCTVGTDRTNVCWVKEGCSSLKPAACSSLPLEVVDHVDEFNAEKLNLHLNKGCYTSSNLQAQLNNAPASCNPPCFRITKPGEYCYMGTRNNNFSNRRHMGQITVTQSTIAGNKSEVVNMFNKQG